MPIMSTSSTAPRMFTASITASAASAGQVRIFLPFDPDDAWGAKRRHHVAGTVNGRPIRAALERDPSADGAPAGGAHFLALGPAWRRDNGLDAGATVDVVLAPEGPIGDRLAPDLRAAFDAAPDADAFFEALPTFYRNNFVRWIEDAKRPATRAARVAETVRLAGEGQRER